MAAIASGTPNRSITIRSSIRTDPDIRDEVKKLKAAEKEVRILNAAFDEGRFAFISGITREGCRFRNPARRNAWERGWLESERERAEHDSIKAMTDTEKAETRKKLSALKVLLDHSMSPLPDNEEQ